MSLHAETLDAAEVVQRLQVRLTRDDTPRAEKEQLASLICLLESPIFHRLLTLQQSIQDLGHLVTTQPQVTEADFDFTPAGELLINDNTSNQYQVDGGVTEVQIEPTAAGDFSALPQGYGSVSSAANSVISTHKYNIEFQRALDRAAQGRYIETVQLEKQEDTSLGFSVVGLRSDNQGELGIFVKDIQPDGIAARDGRLQEGDQLLAIDGQTLDISHQQAIFILQSAHGLVEIVIARGSNIPVSDQSESDLADQSQTGPSENSTDMVLNTEWTQIEVIDLINDGTGLGFGIIGGRSTGVVVKTILPGGIAYIDGRLRSGDHILQIGDVNVRGMSSEQVAAVLRQAGSHVRLVVARAIIEPPPIAVPHAPIIPTSQLDEQLQTLFSTESHDGLEQIELAELTQEQLSEIKKQNNPSAPDFLGDVQVHAPPDNLAESPEVHYYNACLSKDHHGLGITIAGYVGVEQIPGGLSGIFVKSIAEGSAAAHDGQIEVNDQIVEVDGQSLQGFTNLQAVEVLKLTGQTVNLTLARYKQGPKFEQLQKHLQASPSLNDVMGTAYDTNTSVPVENGFTDTVNVQLFNGFNQAEEESDVNIYSNDDYDGALLPGVEDAIKACWLPIIGDDFEVVVAQLSKFQEGGGLGISLEGTVDVENGVEVRPHHYIRTILPQGPVGLNNRLHSGDELLEVNGKRLLGLNHVNVVNILKELPQHVRIVCARRFHPISDDIYAPDNQQQQSIVRASGSYEENAEQDNPTDDTFALIGVQPATSSVYERLIKSKSEMALSSSPEQRGVPSSLSKLKSRSLEPLTGLAMWSTEPVIIELVKGDKGLGFSILDYQDPLNPSEVVIVIRSLVPGGVAQQDGRLVPGDRLVFVNDANVESATLDEAVQALKGAPRGLVRIGVAKPLPIPESVHDHEHISCILAGSQSMDTTATTTAIQQNTNSTNAAANQVVNYPVPFLADENLARRSSPPSSPPHPPPAAKVARMGSTTSNTSSEGSSFIDADTVRLKRQDSFYDSDENQNNNGSRKVGSIVSPTAVHIKQSDLGNKNTHKKVMSASTKSVIREGVYNVDRAEVEYTVSSRALDDLSSSSHSKSGSELETSETHSPQVPHSRINSDIVQDATVITTTTTTVSTTAKIPPAKPSRKKSRELINPNDDDDDIVAGESERVTVHPQDKAWPADSEADVQARPMTISKLTLYPSLEERKPVVAPKPFVLQTMPAEITKLELDVDRTPSQMQGNTDKYKPPISPRKKSLDHGLVETKKVKPPLPPKPKPSPHLEHGAKEDGLSLPSSPPSRVSGILSDSKAYSSLKAEEEIQVSLASHFVHHQRTGSATSSVSSTASDPLAHFHTSSDLVRMGSGHSSPHTMSPGMSPLTSPSLMRAWSGSSVDTLPAALERSIKVVKGNDQLGLTIDAIDKGVNGCVVKSLAKGGAVAKDSRIQPGDYILTINNESLRRITNAQARAIMRRASLLTTDISIANLDLVSITLRGQPKLIGHNTMLPKCLQPLMAIPPGTTKMAIPPAPPKTHTATTPIPATTPLYSQPSTQTTLLHDHKTPNMPIYGKSGDHIWVPIQKVQKERTIRAQIIQTVGSDTYRQRFSITYIPSYDAQVHRETCSVGTQDSSPTHHPVMTSPKPTLTSTHKDASLSSSPPSLPEEVSVSSAFHRIITTDTNIMIMQNSTNDEPSDNDMTAWSPAATTSPPPPLPFTSPPLLTKIDTTSPPPACTGVASTVASPPPACTGVASTVASASPLNSPRQKRLAEDGSPASSEQVWGPPRLVELHRQPSKSLGISIVGGRVDQFQTSPSENAIMGIFIKHVLTDSPAGKNATLKTGDRILEVAGQDLRQASHDEAVEVIRNAQSPVTFLVQSLIDPRCPNDLDGDARSVESYDEVTSKHTKSTSAIQRQDAIQDSHLASKSTSQEEGLSTDEEDEDEYGYTTKKLQRRYGDLNGELHVIELCKGTNGLGLSLAGNKEHSTMSTFIAGITPESSAARDGRLHVGDEMLEVNGQVLYGRSHLNASAIIKGLASSDVKIVLLRNIDNLERMAIKPLRLAPVLPSEDVDKSPVKHVSQASTSPERASIPSDVAPYSKIKTIVIQKGSTGLGFAIVESKDKAHPGIFVKSITPGGPAAREGQLGVADQVLEVDDHSLFNVQYEKAIEILRSTKGSVKLTVSKSGNVTSASNGSHDEQNKAVITFPHIPGESTTDTTSRRLSQTVVSSQDPKHCQIICGQETNIEIDKGRTGLGMSVVGGLDTLLGSIIIHEIYANGGAANDGRLKPGDQILEVNSEDMREMAHHQAIQVLRQTPSIVKITVFRDETSSLSDEENYELFTVDLIKRPGKGLGVSIVGRRGDVGVYISDIVKGGVAEADNRLMQGDQILSVNGKDMRESTQEDAAALLKTLMGKVTLTVSRLKTGSKTSSRRGSGLSALGLRKSESNVSSKSRGKHSKKSTSEEASNTIRTVQIDRNAGTSLGLSIAGGVGSPLGDRPLVIADLHPQGVASKTNKLKIGDHVLSINGKSTEGLSHTDAVSMLRDATGIIRLMVTQGEDTAVSVSQRTPQHQHHVSSSSTTDTPATAEGEHDGTAGDHLAESHNSTEPELKTIVLQRGEEGLGFSIVGGFNSPHGDLPIYIKNVFSKGAAADNRQLKRGDQIMGVNAESFEGITHEDAVAILKQAKGTVILNVLS